MPDLNDVEDDFDFEADDEEIGIDGYEPADDHIIPFEFKPMEVNVRKFKDGAIVEIKPTVTVGYNKGIIGKVESFDSSVGKYNVTAVYNKRYINDPSIPPVIPREIMCIGAHLVAYTPASAEEMALFVSAFGG